MKTLIDMTSRVGTWLAKELDEVSEVMSEHLKNKHCAVNDVCDELAAYKGKMLRPSLLLLTWKTVSKEQVVPKCVHTAAAVVELIHLATLVHDDVLDEADLRRGEKTINSLRGNEAAVMIGDYLLSSAFHLCSTIENPKLNLLLGEVTNTICAGEVVQLFHRNNVDLDIDLYYQIIHDKTASLIAASCEMGSILGGATDNEVLVLKKFGMSVGTAFQIKDDLLDLLGEQKSIGKPAGRDLEKGKLTLPIISLLSENPELKNVVQKIIINNDREELHRMLDSGDSIANAFGVVNTLVESGTSPVRKLFNNDASIQICALAEQLKHTI
ncbi:MAG: polyprenyl synthetase family protein [Phycisphaerales bacterium]|jgi:octaprenyl-diphosphate synthase|nr:polyprenyl synthetase family protein [Phycisphaerales bacterium]